MSLDQNADFTITATWEDNASAPMISSTQKINAAWKQVRNEQRAVTREFEINNRTLVASTRVIRSVNSVLRAGIGAFQTWTLMQTRASNSAKNLRDAQTDLQDVFAEFGPNSEEYIKALKNAKDAQDDFDQTTRDNLLGTLLIVSSTIASIVTGIGTVIPKIRQLQSISTKLTSTPSKSPVPPPRPSSTPKGSGLKFGGFGKIGGIGAGIASGAASGLLYLAQLMGEQNVSAPSSADSQDVISDNGLENLAKVGGDIINIFNNIISPTPQQMVTDISNATQKSLAFKAN